MEPITIRSYHLSNRTNLLDLYQEENSKTNTVACRYSILIGLILMIFFFCGSCNDKTNNYITWNKTLIRLINTAYFNILFWLFLFVLTATVLPILLLLLSIFYCYHFFICLTLRCIHGKDFGSMLQGVDSIWTIEDNSNSIINILLIIENRNFDYGKIREEFDNKIFQNRTHFEKLLSTHHNFGGYYYTLKNRVKIHDVVKPLNAVSQNNDFLTSNELMAYLEGCAYLSLPKNHKGFWEVLIGTQNVLWDSGDNQRSYYYPIIFRIHHGLIDGISLLRMLVGVLADSNKLLLPHSLETVDINHCFLHASMPKINTRTIFRNLYTTCIVPAIIFLELIIRTQDYNIVHGSPLSGEKILLLKVEQEPKLIDRIKRVKNRFGVHFSDVIFTAISASFHEYFRKHSVWVPERITAIIPSLNINEMNNLNDKPIFQNQFSVAMLNIPIVVSTQSNFRLKTPLINRLRTVANHVKTLRNSANYEVNSWLMGISTILPHTILKSLLISTHSSLIISNLPGPKELLTVFGGNKLMNVLFWIPHKGTTGLGLSLISYNNHLQIGLSADKSLIYSHEEGQEILENIFKYLNEFCIEIN